MSINLYLDDNKVRNLSGFSDQPYKSGGGGGIRFKHLSLFQDKGRLYAVLNDIDKTPEELEQFVTDVSMQENFGGPSIARRELGVYEENNSTAEMSIVRGAKEDHYHIKATGKTLDATRALIRKIKAGTIRPTESHEGGQSGMSLAELEAKLKEAILERDTVTSRLNPLLADLENKGARIRSLYRYANELSHSDRPFNRKCLKDDVVSEINRRLNGDPVVQ